mgnify:FL=1
MREIKNIIFDLGGVIINLDIPKTINEFNKITPEPFENVYTQLKQDDVFDKFDKGEITEEDFFNKINVLLNSNLSFEKMKFAWNAMLLDFPKNRLDLLLKLKNRYRIFLLSNTNETHITEFEASLFENHGFKNLDSFFEKVYYSCRIGMRKPNSDIFEFVLNENGLNPEETLFIDDTIIHVNGASQIGINAYLLDQNREVELLLIENGIVTN